MIRTRRLVDPIESHRPVITKEFDFDRYVDIHKAQTEPTDTELVEKIKEQFYSNNSSVDKAKLDEIWKFVEEKVRNNAGLAEFTLDNDGAKSKYFFPWLINIFRSPATALEMSYGAGPSLDGDWNDDILGSDPEDPLVPFILDDPAFVYNRERQLYVADLASEFQENAWSTNTCAKIVDFGAGRLAWVRHHGFEIGSGFEYIYAFDKDPYIDPSALFDEDLETLGIRYKHGDLVAQFTNHECRDADLVILGGVASYIQPDVFADKVIPAIYTLLNPQGAFFFDLQTETPCYRHSMDILDWPEFALPDSPAKIIDHVEGVRRVLWTKGMKFSAEYKVDTYNKIPSAVMITLQKL